MFIHNFIGVQVLCKFYSCSKKDGDESLAQRAIEAPKEVNIKEDNPVMPVTDHSYDPFPVVSDEWAGRNPFADDRKLKRLSPEQEEPDSTVKSRTPSPSTESSKSPKGYTPNPSPHLNGQLSVDSRYNTIISPVSKHSVSSMESGYDSSMSTPPGSVQMGNVNATSPVFHQETIPELIPAQTNSNTYHKQNTQIHVPQNNNQQLQNPFQSAKQYQSPTTKVPVNPMGNLLGEGVKQEPPFIMQQCAGNKRSHQPVRQPTMQTMSQDFARNPNPVLGIDMLMSSFNDSIPPIAPLKELKTEDLDILEIPAPPSQNTPQTQHSTQWPQNMQHVPSGGQFTIPKNMIPGNMVFNPMQHQQQFHQQQQFRLQPQFFYHTNQ